MRYLCSLPTLVEAHLAEIVLHESGISCRVLNEFSAGALGELPVQDSWPQIWIHNENHLQRAGQVLRELESRDTGHQPVSCTACGESGPAGFETCWKCGAEID